MNDLNIILYNENNSIIDDKALQAIKHLLKLCMFAATEDKLLNIISHYSNSSTAEFLLVITEEENIVGLIGIEKSNHGIKIKHLAVLKEFQQHKIASRLVSVLSQRYNITKIEATSDEDSVGFYQKIGFAVQEIIPSPYPSRKRFYCIFRNELINLL